MVKRNTIMSGKGKQERQSNFFDMCGQCKISCCKDARPPVSPSRKVIIEDYLKIHPIEGVKPPYFTRENHYTHPREDASGYCIFNDRKTRLCRIHPIKPETCVAGPITFDVDPRTKKVEYYLKTSKICPLAGRIYALKNGTLQRHLASAKREIRRLVIDIEPESLKAILKIEEPDTFKVDEEEISEAQEKLKTAKP
jgi:Fe-S-cluster containining protein